PRVVIRSTPLPLPAPLFPYTTLFRSTPSGPHGAFICQSILLHRMRRHHPLDLCAELDVRAHDVHVGRSSRRAGASRRLRRHLRIDRKSTRLNSSHVKTSYAVFGLKKK